jgi:uncharacterized protein with FMN-binding domain
MKKYIIAGVLVVAFVAYLIFANRNSAPVATLPTTTPSSTGPTSNPTPVATSSGAPTTTGSGSGTGTGSGSGSAGQYKDGTYTGSVADAFYGNLQVSVTVQGGAITNITFPQAPSGGHSGDVSAQALPVLAQEAITAQSANVNVVSGATQDSHAFQQSMASALAQAKA